MVESPRADGRKYRSTIIGNRPARVNRSRRQSDLAEVGISSRIAKDIPASTCGSFGRFACLLSSPLTFKCHPGNALPYSPTAPIDRRFPEHPCALWCPASLHMKKRPNLCSSLLGHYTCGQPDLIFCIFTQYIEGQMPRMPFLSLGRAHSCLVTDRKALHYQSPMDWPLRDNTTAKLQHAHARFHRKRMAVISRLILSLQALITALPIFG